MAERHSRDSLLAFLQEHGVQYETYDHPVVMNVEEQAKHVGHLDGGLSKNLFLKDKKNRLYVVSALTSTQVDMKALSVRLGLGKGGVRMAPEESLQSILQVPLGCVTPFALINKSARSVALILDTGFKSKSRIFFHPLSNDASTAVTTDNLDKFLKATGRESSYVDLEAAVVVGKDQKPDLAYLVPKEAENQDSNSANRVGQEVLVASTALPVSEVPAVARQSIPAVTKTKQKAAALRGKEVARVDIGTILATILDTAVAAAVGEVNSLALEEQNKQVVKERIDAAMRLKLTPDLESILMMFKNTVYAEGYKSATGSQVLGSMRRY